MNPVELRARREALGLSQASLAAWMGNAQATVSAWESGTRTIPDGVDSDLAELEDRVESLVGRMVEACLAVDEDALLLTHRTDTELAAAHPDMDGWPAALHRVACARAAAECRVEGLRVPIAARPKS